MTDAIAADDVEVLCRHSLYHCDCELEAGHDEGDDPTPHACPCGGSWEVVDGAARPVTYPDLESFGMFPRREHEPGDRIQDEPPGGPGPDDPLRAPRGPVRFATPPAIEEEA